MGNVVDLFVPVMGNGLKNELTAFNSLNFDRRFVCAVIKQVNINFVVHLRCLYVGLFVNLLICCM